MPDRDITDRQLKAFRRFLERLPHGKELDLVILKAHLLIEEQVVPVYQDVLQPAAQELGKALQTVAKTVHVALAPVSALVWGYDQIKDFVSTKVPSHPEKPESGPTYATVRRSYRSPCSAS